ncbi:hypothetical protein ACFV0C_08920 [Streptomyces sp. NPDC059568]|uniref:hypothetical protein n=1 Tax=Streptomyces sp. NPDC059568 TaxID=3346868 RepID=UPI0036CE9821
MQGEGGQRSAPALPLAEDSGRWVSVAAERTVLGIVHNITSATRLLDLLTVFEGDKRVQTVFSCTESSALDGGTFEFLTARGMLCIPWGQAKEEKFDIAVATSRGGDLHNLRTAPINAPHGAGYNKRLEPGAGSREPGAGSREPGAGSREPGAGSREPGAFGLTPEWLMHDGRLIPSAIVLSHDEQRERLTVSCPEAVPVSVVAGDPCYDQLWASRPFRDDYRRALGIRPGQKLIVVSSTWGGGSILASDDRAETDALRRVLAELPADEYRVLAAVHPNAWYGHGAWQVQNWLAPLMDCGLLLPVPDTEAWKAALLAADGLVGDHGSLTMYGVSLGIPTLLGSFAASKVAPHSPMARLGEVLPRLSSHRPLAAQLHEAMAAQPGDTEVERLRATVTSRPGEAAALLRKLFYERLALPEPAATAGPRLVPVPVPAQVRPLSPVTPAMYVSVRSVRAADGTDRAYGAYGAATVRRYHASTQRRGQERHLAEAHLVADIDDPDSRWSRSADVLLMPYGRSRPAGDLRSWEDTAEVTARFPGCALLAVEEPDDGVLTLTRKGVRLRARWAGRRPWWASAAIAASVAYDRTVSGPGGDEPARVQVSVSREAEPGLLDIAVL